MGDTAGTFDKYLRAQMFHSNLRLVLPLLHFNRSRLRRVNRRRLKIIYQINSPVISTV